MTLSPIPGVSKVCVVCSTERLLEEFGPRKVSKDGLSGECKACASERGKQRYRAQKPRLSKVQTKYKRTHFIENRAKDQKTKQDLRNAVLAYLGGKCCHCGFDDWRALQVDHTNGGGSRELKSTGRIALYKRILAGKSGYQLLCANCNWIKRHENDENSGWRLRRAMRGGQ